MRGFAPSIRQCLWGLLLAVAAGPAHAAWTEPEGHGLVINTVTITFSRANFDQNGELYVAPVKRRIEFSPYIQYGVLDGWTAIVQPTYAQARTTEPEDARAEGFSKIFLGLRHRLFQDDSDVLSVQPGITFSPGDRLRAQLLGGGDAIGELRLLWGHNFSIPDPFSDDDEMPAFAVLELAPRLPEGSGPPVELEIDATLGYSMREDTQLLLQAINKLPLDSELGSYAKYQLQSSTVTELGWGTSIQVGGIYTFAGTNVDQENAAFLALWVRF